MLAIVMLGLGLNFVHLDPIKGLFWSAVVNGIVAPPLMVVMTLIASKTEIMRSFTISWKLKCVGWAATGLMFAVAALSIVGWIRNEWLQCLGEGIHSLPRLSPTGMLRESLNEGYVPHLRKAPLHCLLNSGRLLRSYIAVMFMDRNASAPVNLIRHEFSAIQKWFHGFRAFIQRGSVVDLAVGVMIGAAFGKIVTSFVTDIITPPLGLLLGRVKFSDLKWHLGGPPEAPVTINYGIFIQNLVDFLLVAAALFVVISLINRLHRKPPPPPAELSIDQKLLVEIRDELRKFSLQNAKAPESVESGRTH